MPDLDLVTENGPLRVFTLLHDARPLFLNLGEPGGLQHQSMGGSNSADRRRVHWFVGSSSTQGGSLLPPPLLVRPDGFVAWVVT